jgi:hypothetical protein
MNEEFLSMSQAILFVKETFGLDIKESSLYQARCTNKLPKIKVLGKSVYRKSDLLKLLTNK